ncbi:tigger transposable element-derived protein 1 [Trichonephila clavipes]|uniref:Tigger transposable element-derived protein 1 n=1 Tax=Trichonephila clavipes TaxID=2585209 RepID=A0A8X7BMM3_TRICX|nr:tigger transposable element-derived protein 1 [Trichonephila clavipes]
MCKIDNLQSPAVLKCNFFLIIRVIQRSSLKMFITFWLDCVYVGSIFGSILIQELKESEPYILLSNPQFSASTGWLTGFIKRHSFHNLKIKGEVASADEEAARKYPEKLAKIIKDGEYCAHQVFNADETGLFWEKNANPYLHCKIRKKLPVVLKLLKITLLLCSNASGDRMLKPLLVNRSLKPRALKGKDLNTLPVHWMANKKAWELLVDEALNDDDILESGYEGKERAMTPTEEAAREETLEHRRKDTERKRGRSTSAEQCFKLFSAVYNNYKSFTSPDPGAFEVCFQVINHTSSTVSARIEEQKEKLRIEEREEKLRFEQLRLDEQKRKDEFELEKLRIQTQSKLGADTSKESDTKFLVKEVSKFIHRFDLKEDISLYLKLFERQAQRLNIDQENWVSHLLGLLPTEVSHIIAREPDDQANSYEHVKDLLLKRFKLTPEKFRQLFVTHQKASERTWIDFYHELNTYFNGWIDGLKIDTFNKLSDLIITDQLKRKTPFEFKEYYLDEWANMNSPVQLAEKLEEFEDFKRTLKQKSSGPNVKKQEFRFTEKNRRYESPGKFEYNKKDKKFPASTNYNKHYEAPVTKYESVQRYQDSAQKGYYNKNYEKHSNHNASKHAQTNYSKSQKFKKPPKETCTLIVKEGLRTKEIFLES